MRSTLMTMTTLLALAPAALAGQAATGEAGGQARIDAAVRAAAQADIPTELIENKVREGRAKGVATARIATAVETRLSALMRARDALGRAELAAVTAGELSVAADALEAGVSEEALISVSREAPEERRAVATAVLTSLVQLGVASDQARVRVGEALMQGSEALANLRAEVAASLGIGIGGGGSALLPSEAAASALASGSALVILGGGS